MTYSKRIYGAAIIKAVNANYNADFSGQPRTLPNGVVYATDKALKYAVKNFLKENYKEEKVFYFKRYNEDFIPYSLDDAFATAFPDHKDEKDKKVIASDLLSCIDIRLFGATFAKKSKTNNVAISVHGPVQITHGVNIWHENNFYSEQIMSPFRNPNEKNEDNSATTLGRQSRLHEGHYLHHFSVNPKNLEDITELAGKDAKVLSTNDIIKLKEALKKGVTYYDSAAKTGCENELLLWVTLKPESKLVLPNFTQLIKMAKEKNNDKVQLDLIELKNIVDLNATEIEGIEIYLNSASLEVKNAPQNATIKSL